VANIQRIGTSIVSRASSESAAAMGVCREEVIAFLDRGHLAGWNENFGGTHPALRDSRLVRTLTGYG
jgi:hypothetical protein